MPVFSYLSTGGGSFVIGQEQDDVGGNFNQRESFIGQLGQLNVWDRVISLHEIEHMLTNCDKIGNVIAWPSIQGSIHGQVKQIPSVFCEGMDVVALNPYVVNIVLYLTFVWSYVSHSTWLWPYFRKDNLRLRLVGLSTPSVPTLCLKDPKMRDDTIYPELLTVGEVRWNRLPVGWQLKYKKTFPLTLTTIYWNTIV